VRLVPGDLTFQRWIGPLWDLPGSDARGLQGWPEGIVALVVCRMCPPEVDEPVALLLGPDGRLGWVDAGSRDVARWGRP